MYFIFKYILPAYLLFSVSEGFSQQRKIDSLLKMIRNEGPDTNKVNMLNDLSKRLLAKGKHDSAIQYADSARNLAVQLNFKSGAATALINVCLSNYQQGNYYPSLQNGTAALVLRQELGDKHGAASCLNQIGNIYYRLGNYAEALRSHLKALRLRQEIRYNEGIAVSFNNIGNIHSKLGDPDEALLNYRASLKISEEIADKNGIASAYGNIGVVYDSRGNYDEALKNFSLSLKISEETGDKKEISRMYNNIGGVYLILKNYPEAMKNFTASLKIKEEAGFKGAFGRSYNNIGITYLKMGKIGLGKQWLEKGLQMGKETKSRENIKEGYGGLALADSLAGDFKQALADYKLFILYGDSLVNEENTKKAVQFQMQFDFDKKMSADSIKNSEQVKQENLKHDQEIRQQKTYTYGGVIGFVLMLIVAGVSFRANKQKQKANLIITEQKYLVERKQKEILDSIHYAKRIQRSLLPTEKYIHRTLKKLLK